MVRPLNVNLNDYGAYDNKLSFPGVCQENFAPISRYKLILKGLNCMLSWGELLLPAGDAADRLHGSRAALKLTASPFAIPKLVKKSVEVYDSGKKVRLCVEDSPDNAKQIKKVIRAVADLFLASVSFVNKSSKVLFALDKTRVIDLTRISEDFPERLDQVSFVTSLPTLYLSIRKLASAIQRYIETEKEEKKQSLRVTIAIRSFKVFTSALGYVSYFLPALVPPAASLALSTIAFSISLGKAVADSEWTNDQSSIALKTSFVYS